MKRYMNAVVIENAGWRAWETANPTITYALKRIKGSSDR